MMHGQKNIKLKYIFIIRTYLYPSGLYSYVRQVGFIK